MNPKIAIVIPSYWGWEGGISKPGDMIFDHPTPMDEDGTLKRCLESLNVLWERSGKEEFFVIVIGVPVNDALDVSISRKLGAIISKTKRDYPLLLFLPPDLKRIVDNLKSKIEDIEGLINLRGYSQVRNLCLILPLVLGADFAVLVDDDEVVEDKNFLKKAVKFFDEGKFEAKAGYYVQPYGGYLFQGKSVWWKRPFWDNQKKMNEAFAQLIGKGPRIKDTPLVFGGNMVVSRKLMESGIPFDPWITRGEDIDYLINVKGAGFRFVLDNELAIRHLPPPAKQEDWIKMGEDVKRFLYARAKLRTQKRLQVIHPVTVKELKPYPGYFLDWTLRPRIVLTNKLLMLRYLSRLNFKKAFFSVRNILLIFRGFKKDIRKFFDFKERFERLIPLLRADVDLKKYLETKIL